MTDPTMAVMRGDSLTFDVDLTITVDGDPVTDLADWEPVCQFRTGSDSSSYVEPAVTIDGTVCSFALTSTVSADMNPGEWVWDVQVTNPDAAEGLGTYTWPPADEPRNTLAVVGDVARPVAEETP